MTLTSPRTITSAGAVVALAALGALAWVSLCRLSEDRGRALDDAFITYVYARNLAEGHGIRYNQDDPDPTEGSSSLLSVGTAAVAISAGLDPLAATRGASVVLFMGIPLLLALAISRAAAVPFPASLLAAGTVQVLWALLPETRWHLSTGMETVAFAGTYALAFAWALVVTLRRDPPGTGALVLGLLPLALLVLLRPEGVILAAGTLFMMPLARVLGGVSEGSATWQKEVRALLPLAAILTSLVIMLFIWKIVYFGDTLPNAYWVKSHNKIFGSTGALLPGALHVAQFLVLRWVPLATLAFGILASAMPGRPLLAVAALVGPSLGVELLYVRAIHEAAGGFRYGYPLLVPLFCTLALGLALAWRRTPRGMVAGCVAGIVAVPLLLTGQYAPVFHWVRAPWASATAWIGYEYDGDGLAKLGLDLRDTGLGKDLTILLSGAGTVPWYSRAHAIDWIGLNTNVLSGKDAMTLDEVWAYIEGQRPDVIYSFLPPASRGASTPEADPAFAAPTVQSSLGGRGSALFSYWNHERVAGMFWREMRYVRDQTVFGACYNLPGDWVLLAYVRRDSPHRKTLERGFAASTRAGCERPDLKRLYVNDPRQHR